MELLKNKNFIIVLIAISVLAVLTYKLCFSKVSNTTKVVQKEIIQRCDRYIRPRKSINKPYSIICSCTTSPSRLNKMFDTIYTLENQTLQPDYLLLNLPFVFARTQERYLISDYISSNSLVKVNRTMRDYGPATKLVGAIEYLPQNSNTWIVVHDDDILYMQETIEEYYKHIEATNALINRFAFTFSGFNFQNLDVVEPADINFQKVSIIEGFASYCVHRSYFDDDFIPYINFLISSKDARLSDDLIISNYLKGKGITCFNLFTSSVNKRKIHLECTLDYGKQSDALHQIALTNSSNLLIGGHYEKYVRVLKFLSENNINFINNY